MQGIRQVAVARRVRARRAIVGAEQAPFTGETQRKVLRERRDVHSGAEAIECLANRAIGGVARHDPERRWTTAPSRPRGILEYPKVQKRLSRENVEEGLDDPAHPRGHSAGHDTEREPSVGDGVLSACTPALEVRRARGRRVTHVILPRGLDEPAHAIDLRGWRNALTASTREHGFGDSHEARCVKASEFETDAEVRLQGGEFGSEFFVAHRSMVREQALEGAGW